MPEQEYERAGTVTLDGKNYQLLRTPSQNGQPGGIPYKIDNSNEPPWEFRLPDILSEKSLSWDQGGFKSYQGVEQIDTRFTILPPVNVSEYGINTDGRWPRRLVPGPAINSYTLTGNTSSITWIFNGPGTQLFGPFASVYAVAGNNVYLIAGTNATVPAEECFSLAANPPVMGVFWQGSPFIVTTDGTIYKGVFTATGSVEKVPSGAGGVTQWTPSASTNVSNVDEGIGATDSDSTYNSSSTAGQVDTFAYTNYSLAGPYTPVGGIYELMYIRRTSTGGTTPVVRGVCRIGGVNYFATSDAIQNDTSYHLHTYGFPVDPSTGLQWTFTGIDAAEFGYELQTAPGAGVIRITTVSIYTGYYTWTASDAKANWLAVGPRRLFKIYNNSGVITLKNISPSITETTEANWGDDVIIPGGSLTGIKCPLVAYQKTAIVATDKGIHGVDDDGTGIKIIERIDYSIQTMKTQDPYLYISHGHGTSRWVPGLVQATGIEQEIENESIVKGTVTALAFLGKWTFAAITPTTGNNQILVGRERESSDNHNYGPMVWDTLIETGNNETIYCLGTARIPLINGTTSFGLFFEYGNNLGYCTFPETGGIPEIDSASYTFVTTGIRYSPRYKFRDVRDKYFYKILARGKNNTASIYWEIAYKIDDEASWHTTDINSVNMRINADTLYEFKLSVTTTGQYIQFRFTYTSNDATLRSWINYFEVMAIPQGRKIQDLSMVLLLTDNIRHYDNEIEIRDVDTQLSDLQTLMSSPTLILGKGPFSNTTGVYLMPRDLKELQVTQQDSHFPEHTVQVTFRVIE